MIAGIVTFVWTDMIAVATVVVIAGSFSLGDVIAVNGLLIQLARPMDFIGYTVRGLRVSARLGWAMLTAHGGRPGITSTSDGISISISYSDGITYT